PGAGAGLNELAAETLAKSAQGLRVTKEQVGAARLGMSMVAEKNNFVMPVPKLKAILQNESKDVANQSLQSIPGSDTYLKALNKVISQSDVKSGNVSFKDLLTLEQGFNRIKDEKTSEVWAAASGALIDDLEAATMNPKISKMTRDKMQAGLD